MCETWLKFMFACVSLMIPIVYIVIVFLAVRIFYHIGFGISDWIKKTFGINFMLSKRFSIFQ